MAPRVISVVPNVLSVLRLGLAACFWLVPAPWRLPAVLAGGASDWLDGLIARRFGATSFVGGMLDAIADKLFTLSVLLTLAADGVVAWWQVGLVLVRDLVVAGLGLYAVSIGRLDAFRHMKPKLAGKTTTFAVFFWFIAVLAPAPEVMSVGLFLVAAGASILAGLDYFRTFLQRPESLRGRRSTRAPGV